MFSEKISSITPSMTISISTKVAELRSQGENIINLSIGEPDFLTPKSAKDKANWAIDNDKTKYDKAAGLLELREAICKKLKDENGLTYSTSQIIISSGAKHSITNTLLAFLNQGDEVIIPKPYWTSYPEMVKLVGGVPILVDTKPENNYKLTVDELASAITPHTKLLLINNPSNPAGTVYTKDELTPIVNYAIEHNLFILADEIYERICYTGEFTSIASISEEVKKKTILVNGLSKSAAMTGWRLGYVACEEEIAKTLSKIQGHLVSHPSTISQWAGLGALEDGHEEMQDMIVQYKKRRDEAIKLLNTNDKIKLVYPDGAFYLFMDVSAYKDKLQLNSSNSSYSIELCNQLLEKEKVALVPGAAFGMDDFIRMSYAADIEDVKEGVRRLISFLDSL